MSCLFFSHEDLHYVNKTIKYYYKNIKKSELKTMAAISSLHHAFHIKCKCLCVFTECITTLFSSEKRTDEFLNRTLKKSSELGSKLISFKQKALQIFEQTKTTNKQKQSCLPRIPLQPPPRFFSFIVFDILTYMPEINTKLP